MNRVSSLVWALLIVIGAFLLYSVKYEVQSLKSQVASVTRELEREKEALHVVAAEWAYLNRPQRLQALADKYLVSDDLTVSRVADIEAIPFPDQAEASLQAESGLKQASVKTGTFR